MCICLLAPALGYSLAFSWEIITVCPSHTQSCYIFRPLEFWHEPRYILPGLISTQSYILWQTLQYHRNDPFNITFLCYIISKYIWKPRASNYVLYFSSCMARIYNMYRFSISKDIVEGHKTIVSLITISLKQNILTACRCMDYFQRRDKRNGKGKMIFQLYPHRWTAWEVELKISFYDFLDTSEIHGSAMYCYTNMVI